MTQSQGSTVQEKGLGKGMGGYPRFFYLTGVVLKKHGLNSGVTPEMVKDLNKLHVVPNDLESAAQLKWALHVLRGYVAAGPKK